MNKDRLLALADDIETLPWSHPVEGVEYGFSMWQCVRDLEEPCCVAAFATQLFSEQSETLLADDWGGDMDAIHAEAARLLGLEDDVAKELFTPTGADAFPGQPGFISAYRAADTIRRLADTGAVNWGDDKDYEDAGH